MSRQWIIVVAVIAVVAGGAGLALRLSPEVRAVVVGAPAPDFAGVDISSGQRKTLASYEGDVVLINVWATWCEPCRVEMPSMQRLYEQLGDRGFRIAAVSIDAGGPEKVRAFAAEYELTFDILHDPSGSIQRTYQTTGVPESWVVDRHGIIVKKRIGAEEWDNPANLALFRRLLDDDAP